MTQLNFSFKPNSDDSEIIAQISKKSKHDRGKLIYLNHQPADSDDFSEGKLELFHEFMRNKRLNQELYDELAEAIESNEIPTDKRLKALYTDFKAQLKKTSEIRLQDCELEVCPLIGHNERDKKSRETILVNGQAGSGKSYWVGDYLRKWQKLFPKSPIFLLSNKPIEDEPAFDKIKNIQQIPLTHKALMQIVGKEEFLNSKAIAKMAEDEEMNSSDEDTYAPYEFFKSKTGQSMVVFDDFESDGKIEKLVRTIINSVLRVGRASRIYSIIVTHTLCGGLKTKCYFEECDSFVFFPRGISPYHMKYALKNYTKMNEHQITKILDTNSKWAYIHKSYPNYVVEQMRLWLF